MFVIVLFTILVAATHYDYKFPFEIEFDEINAFVIALFAMFDVLTHCDVKFPFVIHPKAS